MDLVYLAGAPATGKSSLMAALTAGVPRIQHYDMRMLPYDELLIGGEAAAAEIGRRRPNFPGTDALARSALPVAGEWIASHFYDLVLAEGDRLTHIRFLDAAAVAGYRVSFLLLTARAGVLDARCTARGSTQSKSWRMGRATMCMRVAAYAEEAGYNVRHLNAERPLDALVTEARERVPALNLLRSAGGADAGADAGIPARLQDR